MNEVAKMSMGYRFSMIITKDGKLWGAGINDKNQLTNTVGAAGSTVYVEIGEAGETYVDVKCGHKGAICVATDGGIYGTGISLRRTFNDPATTQIFNNSNWTNVLQGREYTLAHILPSGQSVPGFPSTVRITIEGDGLYLVDTALVTENARDLKGYTAPRNVIRTNGILMSQTDYADSLVGDGLYAAWRDSMLEPTTSDNNRSNANVNNMENKRVGGIWDTDVVTLRVEKYHAKDTSSTSPLKTLFAGSYQDLPLLYGSGLNDCVLYLTASGELQGTGDNLGGEFGLGGVGGGGTGTYLTQGTPAVPATNATFEMEVYNDLATPATNAVPAGVTVTDNLGRVWTITNSVDAAAEYFDEYFDFEDLTGTIVDSGGDIENLTIDLTNLYTALGGVEADFADDGVESGTEKITGAPEIVGTPTQGLTGLSGQTPSQFIQLATDTVHAEVGLRQVYTKDTGGVWRAAGQNRYGSMGVGSNLANKHTFTPIGRFAELDTGATDTLILGEGVPTLDNPLDLPLATLRLS